MPTSGERRIFQAGRIVSGRSIVRAPGNNGAGNGRGGGGQHGASGSTPGHGGTPPGHGGITPAVLAALAAAGGSSSHGTPGPPPFGPTTPILDDFDRADENPLSDGGKWSTRGGASDALLVVSHLCGGASGPSTLKSEFWNAASFAANQEVYVNVPVLGASADYVRLWLRLTGAGTSLEKGYMMQWSNDANGASIFKENLRDAFTSLIQNTALRFAANDQLWFQASGTTLTIYQNAVSVLTVNDSTLTTGGNIALGMRNTTIRCDSFGGGSI